MSATNQSFFTGGTIIVPVGQVVDYNCTGNMFLCKEASDVFSMAFDNGEFFPMEVGLSWTLNGSETFEKLSFRNDTSSIITIQFYVGVGSVHDARLNTVINRLMIVGMKDVPTYTKGAGALGVLQTAGPNLNPIFGPCPIFTGIDAATGAQRKQITIQNADNSNWLWIADANNLMLAYLAPGQSWTMQSSGTFKLAGSNGLNCLFVVCETFYSS